MAPPKTIDLDELKRWMDAQRPFVLLDVLPADVFAESRLPGAQNACVYEVTFLDQAADLIPDSKTPVVVYCADPSSRASTDAAERLVAAGYPEVFNFTGGREAWREAGLPFEGRPYEPPPEVLPADGEWVVDTEHSAVGWVGRNPGGSHEGTLRVRSGGATVHEGRVAKGAFEIDMSTIEVADLSGDMAALLKRHLESDDFFAVDRHPVAHFEITRMTPIEGATPGAPNFDAEGKLTLRGVTNPVAFPAIAMLRGENELALEAHFDIERTRWNVNYGSGKLYAHLGMHLVNDHISIQVRVLARPA